MVQWELQEAVQDVPLDCLWGDEWAVRKEEVLFYCPTLVKGSPLGVCMLLNIWIVPKWIPRLPALGEEDETCRCGLKGGPVKSHSIKLPRAFPELPTRVEARISMER